MADDTGMAPGPAPPDRQAPPYDARGEAKRLLRTIRAGGLATLAPSGPFASLVSVATLADGSPVMALSGLAAHTAHLAADPRASLLLAEGGKGDPLAHPRLTLVGRAERVAPEARQLCRARFLRRHPKAALYVDFADFSFWRIAVDAAHLNGGFARAARFEGADILTATAGAEALLATEAAVVDRVNAEYADALRLRATARAGAPEGPWRATGMDPEGLDLSWGDRTTRLTFTEPVLDTDGLRAVLVGWAARAGEQTH